MWLCNPSCSEAIRNLCSSCLASDWSVGGREEGEVEEVGKEATLFSTFKVLWQAVLRAVITI